MICISWRKKTFIFLLQKFHPCGSDMLITRFAAVLVLFSTGMCVNTVK